MPPLNKAWRSFLDWGLHTEASTRSSALIRIFLALLIWSRWSGAMTFFTLGTPEGLLFGVNFFIATTLMLFGIWTRLSTLWTAAIVLSMYYYAGWVRGIEPWTHHHTYLLAFATFLCALTPCGKSYSVDRYLSVRKAKKNGSAPPGESGNLWALRLISLQVAFIYFWTAFDKTNWQFLGGDRMEYIFMWLYTGSDYPDLAGFHTFMIIISWATVLLEYSLIGLLFKRFRMWLVLPGLLFHGLIYILLPVGTFSLTMWALYLSFFDPDKVHAVMDDLSGSSTPAS
jgi:hypothetical protein